MKVHVCVTKSYNTIWLLNGVKVGKWDNSEECENNFRFSWCSWCPPISKTLWWFKGTTHPLNIEIFGGNFGEPLIQVILSKDQIWVSLDVVHLQVGGALYVCEKE